MAITDVKLNPTRFTGYSATAGSAGRPLLDARDLTRRFGDRLALDCVSLELHRGEIHVVLGPHAAGKTSLLRTLAGLAEPTKGAVLLAARAARPRELRSHVRFIPAGDGGFYRRLSGLENLAFFARMEGLRRREALARGHSLLTSAGLAEQADAPVGEWPLTLRPRLAFARALLSEPAVLLIDGPTENFDSQAAHQLKLLASLIASRGTAILWTTRSPHEVRGFADRITFLSAGHVRFTGKVHDLVVRPPRRYVLRVRSVAPSGPFGQARLQRAVGTTAIITLASGDDPERVIVQPRAGYCIGDTVAALAHEAFSVVSCREARSDIEEEFISLTEESPA